MLKIGKIAVGLLIISGIAFANPITEMNNELSISKSDSEMLFKDGATNAVALSSDEMKATEGEWINVAIWAGYRGYQVYRSYGVAYRWSFGLYATSFNGWR